MQFSRTIRSAIFAASVALALLSGLSEPVRSQDAGLRVSVPGITELDYPFVQAVVDVEDTTASAPGGLGVSNFSATINGGPAPVAGVELASSQQLPLDVLLMIDTSGSTEGEPLAQAKTAAITFIRSLAPEDRVAIMRFANSVTVQQDFTTDKEAAVGAVNGLRSTGQTELYKAAAGAINQAATSPAFRRAVILLTDGAQDAVVTDVTAEGAYALAAASGIPVFTIAQGAAIEDSSFLFEVARVSNGRYLEAPAPGDLQNVYASIGRLLQNQYLVTIDASGSAGQAAVDVGITVNSVGRTASATGRFAPSPAFAAPAITVRGVIAGESLDAPRLIEVEVAGPQSIDKAAFIVDGVNVFETSTAPFAFTYDPDKFGESSHSLRVSVTVGGRIIDAPPVPFTSIPRSPTAAPEPGDSGGGSGLPVLAVAAVLAALTALGIAYLVVHRIRTTSGPSLAVVSPDQRVTPWATRHRPVTPPREQEPQAPDTTRDEAQEIGEPLGMLLSHTGSDAGHEYLVGGKPVSIGSGDNCAVRIDDPSLASEEARLWIRKQTLMYHRIARLTTIATTGGTGGWTMLEPGETFAIGSHTFEFKLLPRDAPVPEPGATAPDPDVTPMSTEIPNILRDKPDASPRGAPSMTPFLAPSSADSTPRRLTEMMPRDMGFSEQDLDPEERAG
jgi:VWFA-related protein